MLKISEHTKHLRQSGIRAASIACAKTGGINLGQGICDMPTPDKIKQKAYAMIEQDKSTYSACEGIFELRQAIAQKCKTFNHIDIKSVDEVMVTHGSTGAFVSAINTLLHRGDEVILFEPFYGYHKNLLELHGMVVKAVTLDFNDFSFDLNDLKKAITPRTKAIVICTPCNPCGKVFSKEELLAIGTLAELHDLVVITDEIYEYITYPGFEHVSFSSLKNFKERTITISGFSKTYNMTGWRLGYATGPAHVIENMALVQDLLYVCPATPLQHAVLAAFELGDDYYQEMQKLYLEKRDSVVKHLRDMGFVLTVPQGAYYIMVDFSALKYPDDQAAVDYIFSKTNVATVPGRSFYLDPQRGKNLMRICYALNKEKIMQALKQMQSLVG